MTEMFGEAWSPMSVPDLAPDDDDDDDPCRKEKKIKQQQQQKKRIRLPVKGLKLKRKKISVIIK